MCFRKVANIWNFRKVAINFCDSVNPLRVSSRFSRSKHNDCCGVAAIVLPQWQCSFFDRLCCINGYSFKKKYLKKMQAQKQVSKMGQHCTCPQFFVTWLCRRLPFGWVCSGHVLHWRYPKSERNKTRLTLAPTRGSLGVLWTFSGATYYGTVLNQQKTRRQAHRHTHVASLSPARSKQTRAVRPVRVWNTRLCTNLRHKYDQNRPVKTATAALPFLY